jgi:hypothetical protein
MFFAVEFPTRRCIEEAIAWRSPGPYCSQIRSIPCLSGVRQWRSAIPLLPLAGRDPRRRSPVRHSSWAPQRSVSLAAEQRGGGTSSQTCFPSSQPAASPYLQPHPSGTRRARSCHTQQRSYRDDAIEDHNAASASFFGVARPHH